MANVGWVAAWSGTGCCYHDIRVSKSMGQRHALIALLEGTRSIGKPLADLPGFVHIPSAGRLPRQRVRGPGVLGPKGQVLFNETEAVPSDTDHGLPRRLEVSQVRETVKDPQVLVHRLERANSRQRHASLDKADSSFAVRFEQRSCGRHCRAHGEASAPRYAARMNKGTGTATAWQTLPQTP